jgi:hypothetical protein
MTDHGAQSDARLDSQSGILNDHCGSRSSSRDTVRRVRDRYGLDLRSRSQSPSPGPQLRRLNERYGPALLPPSNNELALVPRQQSPSRRSPYDRGRSASPTRSAEMRNSRAPHRQRSPPRGRGYSRSPPARSAGPNRGYEQNEYVGRRASQNLGNARATRPQQQPTPQGNVGADNKHAASTTNTFDSCNFNINIQSQAAYPEENTVLARLGAPRTGNLFDACNFNISINENTPIHVEHPARVIVPTRQDPQVDERIANRRSLSSDSRRSSLTSYGGPYPVYPREDSSYSETDGHSAYSQSDGAPLNRAAVNTGIPGARYLSEERRNPEIAWDELGRRWLRWHSRDPNFWGFTCPSGTDYRFVGESEEERDGERGLVIVVPPNAPSTSTHLFRGLRAVDGSW